MVKGGYKGPRSPLKALSLQRSVMAEKWDLIIPLSLAVLCLARAVQYQFGGLQTQGDC